MLRFLSHLPILRHPPKPLDPALHHLHIRVQPLGHGLGDERAALLLQELDQPPLVRDQLVDARRLPVQKGGDGALFGEGRET